MYLLWVVPNVWSLNNFSVDKKAQTPQIDAVYWSLRVGSEVLDKDKETFVVLELKWVKSS